MALDIQKPPLLEIPDWIWNLFISLRWYILGYYIDVGSGLANIVFWIVQKFNEYVRRLYDNDSSIAAELVYVNDYFRAVIGQLLRALDSLYRRVNALEEAVVSLGALDTTKIKALFDEWAYSIRMDIVEIRYDIAVINKALYEGEPPWWRPDQIWAAITEGIGNIIMPGGETDEDAKNLFQWLWIFFRDPPKFLYQMSTEIIVRFF